MKNNKDLVKIAFILHPLNMENFFEYFDSFFRPFSYFLKPILKLIPPHYIKVLCAKIAPHKFMEIDKVDVGNDKQIGIIGILCPFFPEQMMLRKDEARKKIYDSVVLARRLGAKVVTLTGFTSIVTNEVDDFWKGVDLAVTSGNTLTASLCIEAIEKISELASRKLEKCVMAIIGATGDIGSVCAKYFSDKVGTLILNSRNIKETDSIVKYLNDKNRINIRIERSIDKAVGDADIIITATSSFGFLLDYKNFKRGSIVCDVSMPPNVAKGISKRDNDIFVFEGGKAGLTFFEEIKDDKWRELFPNNAVYGCLAESLVLALTNRFENYSLGKGNITESKIAEIKKLSNKSGVFLSEFYCSGEKYSKDDIEKLKTFNR